MLENHDDGEEPTRLAERLERWRHEHGGRGRRIPEDFWLEAAVIAQREGPAHVAKILRLRQARLESLIAELAPPEDTSDFVELSWPAMATPSVTGTTPPSLGGWEPDERALIVMEDARGNQLRLGIRNEEACDVGPLVETFLRFARCSK